MFHPSFILVNTRIYPGRQALDVEVFSHRHSGPLERTYIE